jgi:hypothetical protein
MKNLRHLVLFLCVSVASDAYGNDITLFGGLQHQRTLTLEMQTNPPSRFRDSFTFGPNNFGVFGASYAQGKVFGSEHTLAYAPNFMKSQTKAVIYHSNFLAQLPALKVRPYATAGLGTFFTSGTGITDIGNKFALNYGGGLKIFPSGPVGGRLDFRGYRVRNIEDDFNGHGLNVFDVTIGLVFSLGR